jgi:hypothetical protein
MNQPRKDAFHMYSKSPHLPQFQKSAGATPLWSLWIRIHVQYYTIFMDYTVKRTDIKSTLTIRTCCQFICKNIGLRIRIHFIRVQIRIQI